MNTISRRRVLAITAAAAALPTMAARRRKAADLIVTALQWTVDEGINWNNDPVLDGDAVVFRATVKNQGTAATPPGTIIGVGFLIDNIQVSWSDSFTAGLAANASVTVEANGGSDGDKYWIAASVGTHAAVAFVDDINRIPSELNENNNTLQRSITVEAATPGVVANDDTASTPVNTPVDINVLANDVAPAGTTLIVTAVQSPTSQGGTVTIAADQRSVRYTPPAGFSGGDTFTYQAEAV